MPSLLRPRKSVVAEVVSTSSCTFLHVVVHWERDQKEREREREERERGREKREREGKRAGGGERDVLEVGAESSLK